MADPLRLMPGANILDLESDTLARLRSMAVEYMQRTGRPLQVNSGYRSLEQQAALNAANPAKAAPAGRSMHNYGFAVDIQPDQAEVLAASGLLAKHGFHRPLILPGVKYQEAWHIERVGLDYKKVRALAGFSLLGLLVLSVAVWWLSR